MYAGEPIMKHFYKSEVFAVQSAQYACRTSCQIVWNPHKRCINSFRTGTRSFLSDQSYNFQYVF